jgi:hypothetical protein
MTDRAEPAATIVAIVVGAGFSSRIGAFRPLATDDGVALAQPVGGGSWPAAIAV